MTALSGIAWDHPRAMEPLVATARSWRERAGVEVAWRARTLQEFADAPVTALAERFDLLVVDHPWTGHAAATGAFLPLDAHLDASFLTDLEEHAVGASFASYRWDSHVWALPIDAASQVAAYRPDLLDGLDCEVPSRWEDVLALGRKAAGRGMRLGLPLIPVDALMCLLTLCTSLGEPPSFADGRFVARATGREALGLLRELRDVAHPEAGEENPIRVLDRMACSAELSYCPLAFGYSNYARTGFRPHPLAFAPAPSHDGRPLGAVLGGTGLAVSAATADPQAACAYAAFVASPEVQAGEYLRCGGQPADRRAWLDPRAEDIAPRFFAATLPTLDRAYLRPRYDGFVAVQDEGGPVVHEHLFGTLGADEALDALDRLVRASGAGGALP